MRIFLFLFFSVFLFSCAQPQTQLPEYSTTITEKEKEIQNQMFADSWLNAYLPFSEMGIDILFSASEFCLEEDRIYSLGMNLANEFSAYENIRKEINKTLSLGKKLKVISVGKKTPAFKAGIKVGDEILEINGENIIQGEKAYQSYINLIENDYAKTYKLKILRNDQFLNINIKSEQRCRFNFIVDLDNNTFNAFADGNNMVFSLRMVKWLIKKETNAAIVFAHELGHNANRHIADKMQNASTGALLGLLIGIYVGLPNDMMEIGQNIGASAYSIDYENEADYLMMYILAKSGYDLSQTIDFWRSFALEVPNSIYSEGGSHPSTAERYVRMESAIKEINDKINRGDKLIPTYKSE